VRPGLLQFFSDPCAGCHGTGKVLSLASMANKIDRVVRRVGAYMNERKIRLLVNPEVEAYCNDEARTRLLDLSKDLKMEISFEAAPDFLRDELRVISVRTGEDITEQAT
jgi:Ribonuclease G/E